MPGTTPATMDTAQVRDLLADNSHVRLIDVRSPGEFATMHIPGSSNVPLDLLREHQNTLTVEHDDPIVLICGSGARAEQARSLLTPTDLQHLSVLQGGVTDWQRQDAPLEHGSGTWSMERQVRLTAGLLVLTGVLTSTVYRPAKWLAGFVGGGLTFAAVSNTCAMARMLGKLPHNRAVDADPPTLHPITARSLKISEVL